MKEFEAKKKVLADIMGLCDEAELMPFAEKKKANEAQQQMHMEHESEEVEDEGEGEEEEEESLSPEMKEKLLEMYAALKN